MKRFFFLLMLIILASIHQTSYASTTQYKHTSYDLGIAKRHNIDECRINDIVGDEVFFYTVEEGASYEFKEVSFYLINLNSGAETQIPFTLTDTFISGAHYSGKYLYILYHDTEDRQCILQIDKKGNTVNDFRLKNVEPGQSFYNIDTKDDERIFASGNVGIAEYDLNGDEVWYVSFSPFMDYSQYVSGNMLYVLNDSFLYEIDLDKKKLIGNKIITGITFPNLLVYGGQLFSFDQTGVMLIDVDKESSSYIVNFSDYGIQSGNYAIDLDDAGIRFIDYNPFDRNTSVTLHTIDFNSQGQKKKSLLFYFPDYMPFPGEIHEIADGFNRANSEYEVLYGTYGYRDELDTVMTIAEPDVVFMTDSKLMNHESLLSDLMPYMSDAGTLTPQSLLPSVLNNYTEGNSLYMLPIELSLGTYVMKASDFEKSSLSAEDFLTYIVKDGTLCTDYYLSKESITEAIMQVGLTKYVDFKRRTCSFNSADFKDLITKIDRIAADTVFHPDVEYASLGEEDRILDDSRIGCFDFFGKKRAAYGEDVKAVGIPSDNGDGTYIMTALCLAMGNSTGCPEGAFEFIEYFLAHYAGKDREGTILANKELFDETVALLKENHAVTDFFGTKTEITADDIAAITEAVNNSVTRDAAKQAIIEYVKYYTDMYFEGKATLGEVTEDLQAAVTGYLNRK